MHVLIVAFLVASSRKCVGLTNTAGPENQNRNGKQIELGKGENERRVEKGRKTEWERRLGGGGDRD